MASTETASRPADMAGLPDNFTLTLDRTRHFSEVHGDNIEHNLGFIQDGIPFDRVGRLIKHLFEKKNAKELDAKKLETSITAFVDQTPPASGKNPRGMSSARPPAWK